MNSTADSAKSAASNAGQAVDNSMNKVGNFMDDSTITARVKAALIDHKDIRSTDISVKTESEQHKQALSVAKAVEGVTSVNDKLSVQNEKSASLKGYAGDTAVTSEIKAKLLADDIVPSRNVKVETTDGVVHLSGTVESSKQSERAEGIAKAVSGVKSVKNDLSVK
ncbi:MAG: molecular chaperone OsmY [Klebsiella michiganensis]|nr:molecular chaperone OsmY [Klebsiella michiganensis]